MRMRIMAAALALAALPAMAGVAMSQGAAASPVTTQPLAANEVLVELSATGTATSRADLATLTYTFLSRGATEEEARRAHDERMERLRAIGRNAGVAASDMEAAEPASLGAMPDFSMPTTDVELDLDMDVDPSEASEASPEAAAEPAEPPMLQTIQGQMTFRVRDIARVDALNRALIGEGAEQGILPELVYSVSDDSPARREARANAIATARADAEAYAAAMGMRVARVVRVTERSGADLMTLMFSGGLAQQFEQMGLAQGPDIPVRIVVGVDFALAPR